MRTCHSQARRLHIHQIHERKRQKIVEPSSLVLCSRGSYLIVHTSFTTHPQVPAQILNFRDGSFSIVERKRQVGKPCRRKVVNTFKPVFATTKETRWKLYKDTQFQSHSERRTLHRAWQLGLPKVKPQSFSPLGGTIYKSAWRPLTKQTMARITQERVRPVFSSLLNKNILRSCRKLSIHLFPFSCCRGSQKWRSFVRRVRAFVRFASLPAQPDRQSVQNSQQQGHANRNCNAQISVIHSPHRTASSPGITDSPHH